MGVNILNVNDYLLVKAFESAEYRAQFNSGSIYLNSSAKFWELENAFQQDREGEIFRQEEIGYLMEANEDFPKILEKAATLDGVLKCMKEENAGEIIAKTENFSMKLEGYLCCFYLLPKSAVSSAQNTFTINSEQEHYEIREFLNRYLNEAFSNDFYVSIYDAVAFCNVFFKGMNEKGYKINYGKVKYEDIGEAIKIDCYRNGDLNSIIFTKPTKYSYQKEFRIYITKPNESVKDHIIERGFDIESCRVCSFDYANLISKSSIEDN